MKSPGAAAGRRLKRLLAPTLVCASLSLVGAQPAEVRLEPRLAMTAEGTRELGPDDALRPGETAVLALAWPEGSRPEELKLAPVSSSRGDGLRARRIIPRDPRLDGADALEVLVGTLDSGELGSIEILSAGRIVARTRPLTLRVAADAQGARREPSPVRPPARIGIDVLALVLTLLAILVGVLALVWAGRRLAARQRHPGETRQEPEPRAPASVRALDAIEALLSEGLLEKNLVKPFSVSLAEIGKGYLGEIHGLPLLEATSTECSQLLRARGAPSARIEWLSRWLLELDMVKFAEARPAATRLLEAVEELRGVIVETSGDEAAESEPGAAAALTERSGDAP